MNNPRAKKAAIVAEVRHRLADSDAALLTEYRGLDVSEMAELRRALRAAGGEYTVYKNTLVRLAAVDLDLDLGDMLTGPTAIAFVESTSDGPANDPAAVAKALRDFMRTHRSLVIKGGVLNRTVLGPEDVITLAALPSREVMLAQVAGTFAAPLVQMAGLLQALPRNFAYGLSALISKNEELNSN